MMRNPVYSREMKVSSRSIRLPLIIVLFNGILSMVTLLNMYSAVAQVESTAVIQYSSFMDMYEFVTTIEFILLMFIVPAVTAASISGERERQTLELMLTTQMTASQVVIGKLMSALSTLLLLIVSSFRRWPWYLSMGESHGRISCLSFCAISRWPFLREAWESVSRPCSSGLPYPRWLPMECL